MAISLGAQAEVTIGGVQVEKRPEPTSAEKAAAYRLMAKEARTSRESNSTDGEHGEHGEIHSEEMTESVNEMSGGVKIIIREGRSRGKEVESRVLIGGSVQEQSGRGSQACTSIGSIGDGAAPGCN